MKFKVYFTAHNYVKTSVQCACVGVCVHTRMCVCVCVCVCVRVIGETNGSLVLGALMLHILHFFSPLQGC